MVRICSFMLIVSRDQALTWNHWSAWVYVPTTCPILSNTHSSAIQYIININSSSNCNPRSIHNFWNYWHGVSTVSSHQTWLHRNILLGRMVQNTSRQNIPLSVVLRCICGVISALCNSIVSFCSLLLLLFCYYAVHCLCSSNVISQLKGFHKGQIFWNLFSASKAYIIFCIVLDW